MGGGGVKMNFEYFQTQNSMSQTVREKIKASVQFTCFFSEYSVNPKNHDCVMSVKWSQKKLLARGMLGFASFAVSLV